MSEDSMRDMIRQFDEIMVRNGWAPPHGGKFSDDDAAVAISKVVEALITAGHPGLVPSIIGGLIDAIRRNEREIVIAKFPMDGA